MRILVHEAVSGGGIAGRDAPASLVREGATMLAAVVADLSALGRHRIVTTADPRRPPAVPPGVEIVPLSRRQGVARLDDLMASADAVWLIAPEMGRCLEHLAARVARHGKRLLGSDAATIRDASDKARLPRRLEGRGASHPVTRVLSSSSRADWLATARDVGFPLLVKPACGAGCRGVRLVRAPRELERALEESRAEVRGRVLLQRFVRGTAASVSLLADGRRAVALAVNGQSVRGARTFSYGGGQTPLHHPLAGQAADAAVTACGAFPGLRGFVGVDLVLTDTDAIVLEVNPRVTTAYVGVRRALDVNLAALVLEVCDGRLPAVPPARRSVRFTAGGRIVSSALCLPLRLSA